MASPNPPFSVILPGRPVLTNPITNSPTQFSFTFPSQPAFSHIVVFTLPGIEIPKDLVAAIYIQLPESSPSFTLLGYLDNVKASAIFRVREGRQRVGVQNAKSMGEVMATDDVMVDEPDQSNSRPTAPVETVTIGIAIESAQVIKAQLAAKVNSAAPSAMNSSLVPFRKSPSAAPSNAVDTKILAKRIIKNAFNFLASFAGSAGGQEVVPLKSFEDWWTKFERRVEMDSSFLEREAD